MPLNVPAAVGWKVTDWWIASSSPGSICWPSDTGSGTRNGAVGGAALLRVSSRFPALAMSNVFVDRAAHLDVAEVDLLRLERQPRSPVTPRAVTGMVTLPVEDPTTTCEVLAPVEVGANTTGTDTDAPEASFVPAVGRLEVANGAVGALAPVMVVAPVPVLETLTLSVTRPRTGTSPKSSPGGSDIRPGCVAKPCRSKANVPAEVVKVSALDAAPGPEGRNVTGTFNDAPAASLAGRVTAPAPKPSATATASRSGPSSPSP